MALINRAGQEISAKVVYYGPGLSGKTTNLEVLFKQVPEDHRGKMISMKTRTDRTLFFDLLPLNADPINDFQVRILLYTVPGQVYYNATRRLVLKGVDAVVFVADSQRGKLQENLESLENLRSNLADMGLKLDDMPWVIQYNKRDLPDILSVEELDQALNSQQVPSFEAVAPRGDGVHGTLRGVADMLRPMLAEQIERETGASQGEAGSNLEDTECLLSSREPEPVREQVGMSSVPEPEFPEEEREQINLDSLPDPLVVEMPLQREDVKPSPPSEAFAASPSSPDPSRPSLPETPPPAGAAGTPERGRPFDDVLPAMPPADEGKLSAPSGLDTQQPGPKASPDPKKTEPPELLLRLPRKILESGELRLRIVLDEETEAPSELRGELLRLDGSLP